MGEVARSIVSMNTLLLWENHGQSPAYERLVSQGSIGCIVGKPNPYKETLKRGGDLYAVASAFEGFLVGVVGLVVAGVPSNASLYGVLELYLAL